MIPKTEKEVHAFCMLFEIDRIKQKIEKNKVNPYMKDSIDLRLTKELNEKIQEYLKFTE